MCSLNTLNETIKSLIWASNQIWWIISHFYNIYQLEKISYRANNSFTQTCKYILIIYIYSLFYVDILDVAVFSVLNMR